MLPPARVLNWLLSGALALALLGCWLLLRELRGGYRDAAIARLDPLQLGTFPPTARPPGRLLVLFGDSRAAQWPDPNLPGTTILNRGIGGQTSAQVLLRYQAHVAPLRPDVLLLQVGINDLKTIGVMAARRDQTVAECKQRIAAIVALAQAQDATVVLTTVFPTGAVPLSRQLIWSDAIDPAIREVNAYIRSLAGPRVLVLDAAAILADGDRVRPAYARDTLHLAPAGYAALNLALEQLLAKRV